MIIDTIKDYVNRECKKPNNVFGPAFFDQHILKVVEYGKMLAGNLSADSEIVEISAYLHDIAAVHNIAFLQSHNTLSADFTKNFLLEKNYPLERTERVIQAIRAHTSPVQIGSGSLEDVCLSNADAMSQITMPAYWMYFVFVVRKSTFEQGREWLRNKVESNWNSLIEPAKEIIENEYHLSRNIFI